MMKCRFVREIYRNEKSGYGVSVYHTYENGVPEAARNTYYKGKGVQFMAVGNSLPPGSCLQVELTGRWTKGKYGLQLAVESYEEVLPRTEDGIRAYLSSGMVRGIGPKTAAVIVGRFGLKTLDILDREPERLLEIKGITEKKLAAVTESYQKSRVMKDLAAFLSPYQVSPGKIGKIYAEYGGRALDTVRNNPFLLCQISGFGFLTVDRIARANRRSPDAPLRIEGCIGYCMEKEMQEGHLYQEQELFLDVVYRQLNAGYSEQAVARREVSAVLYRMVKDGRMFLQQGGLYPADSYFHEVQTARKLAVLLAGRKPVDIRLETLIAEAQKDMGISLSEKQAESVKMVFSHQVSIITGGPGTGKTTIQKILQWVNDRLDRDTVLLVAPTGRASRRMAESTGNRAFTMHSACQIFGEEGRGVRDEAEMLEADFIIADEQSMVDMRLMWEFVRRIKEGTRLVLIGDDRQLPSVGPGNVFHELIRSGAIPVTALDMVFRQGKHSRIARNAFLMQENSTALEYGSDFVFLSAESDAEAAGRIEEIYLKEAMANGVENVQILTPFRKRGETSAGSLNDRLRQKVNGQEVGAVKMTVLGKEFHVGDKIIQNKNRGQISNGDTGFIHSIFVGGDGSEIARLEFSDGRTVEYRAEEMETIELSYATTVHKSQGSEYPVVIMPWLPGFYVMLKRNILYTGITRAQSKVYLVGSKRAIAQAVRSFKDGSRNTRLGERLAECCRQQENGCKEDNAG